MARCIRTSILALVALASLSACGGGGKKTTTTPPPTPVDANLDWDQGNWDEKEWQ